MPSPIADIFHQAAKLNAADVRRSGNVIHVEPEREVIAAGDLHGNRANLAKIIAYADLARREDRRLILQEIIHAPPDIRTGLDRSIDVLLRAARLKIASPGQVIFLLGNHDVAQATGNEITKAGRGVCQEFVRGVKHACGEDNALEVLGAVNAFLLSAPIAAWCPGGVLVSHTLPSPKRMDLAGKDIPDGPYDGQVLRRGGKVYEWTWGRKQTPEQIEELADHLGVSFFVLAHRHIDASYEFISPKAVILTAEHERGCLLQFPSGKGLTEELARRYMRPIAALARGS